MSKALREAYLNSRTFYRDNFRHTVNFLRIELLLILMAFVIYVFLLWQDPDPEYYATSSVGQITKLRVYDSASLS